MWCAWLCCVYIINFMSFMCFFTHILQDDCFTSTEYDCPGTNEGSLRDMGKTKGSKPQQIYNKHDDVIKWKHFPRNWPFVRGIHRSPVNSPRKGQWRGALMFSLIYVWINDWVNNREAGDLRRYRAHSDVIVMKHDQCAYLLEYIVQVVPLIGRLVHNPFHVSWGNHDMETLSALLALCEGNSPVNAQYDRSFVRRIHRSSVVSLTKGRSCWALMFPFLWVWANYWTNTWVAGDVRPHYVTLLYQTNQQTSVITVSANVAAPKDGLSLVASDLLPNHLPGFSKKHEYVFALNHDSTLETV